MVSSYQILEYLPILCFLFIAFSLSFVLVIISWLRSKKKPYHSKNAPYECGFDTFDLPEDNARRRFNIHFYLVAILFIIFDLEIAYLFPWAIALREIGWFGFWSMILFLAVLTIGFVYEWKKGGLEWH